MAAADGDGARGDDQDLLAGGAAGDDVGDQRLEPVAADRAVGLIDKKSRADLDDQAASGFQAGRGPVRAHVSRARIDQAASGAFSSSARARRNRAPTADAARPGRRRRRRPRSRARRSRRPRPSAARLAARSSGASASILLRADDFRLGLQAGAVGGKLGANGPVGVRHVLGRAVDEMKQHPAALDMAEEAGAQPGAVGGAIDQPGDVGENERVVVALDHAQRGMQGGEGVGGDASAGPARRRREMSICPRSAGRQGRRRRSASGAATATPPRRA